MKKGDVAFCTQVLRHSALGAILGGPILAFAAWALFLGFPERLGPVASPSGGALTVVVGVAAVMLGVWIGATLACVLGRLGSAEETCYAGTFGCVVYLIGGALGILIGTRIMSPPASPVYCYMVGGTVLAVAALGLALLSPFARAACARRDVED